MPKERTEGEWRVARGRPSGEPPKSPWRGDNEQLSFNNPFGQKVERVWYDGKVVYAVELGEVDVDVEKVKVAQEYQVVYSVELDDKGKLKGEPKRVEDQLNIYDSVPGQSKYSPLWQFNYVV